MLKGGGGGRHAAVRRGPCAHPGAPGARRLAEGLLWRAQARATVDRRLAQSEDARHLVHGRRLHAHPPEPEPARRDRDERVLGCRSPRAPQGPHAAGTSCQGEPWSSLLRRDDHTAALGDDRAVHPAFHALQAASRGRGAGSLRPGAVHTRTAGGALRRRRGRGDRARPGPDVLLPGRRGDAQFRHLGRRGPQLPASRQPRSAAAGDRQLPGLPVPPARPDRAEGGLHARQLLHEAAARRPVDRHHEAPRPRGGPRRSGRAPCGCSRSTTRPPRSTRARCSTRCAPTSPACRTCSPSIRRRSPSRRRAGAGRRGAGAGRRRSRRRGAGASDSQLGLF